MNFIKKKVFELRSACLWSALFLGWSATAPLMSQDQTGNGDQENDGWRNLGLYLNVGVFGDFRLDGYESAFVSRDPRAGYQIEMGTPLFALPISFSTGQNVDIIGIKPRLQYLIPIGSTYVQAGPGIGFVYNYWTSDLGLSGTDFEVTVHEFGAQPSLQIMIRPLPFMNLLVTPIAVDFNFKRNVEADAGIKGLGNFSTTNDDLGIIYSGGASVGFNF